MRQHFAAAIVRCRIYWRIVLATFAVCAAVDTGLYFGQRAFRDWSVEVVTSAYDRATNPDFPAEAAWKAMSWEQKRATRQKFEEGLARRKFHSEQLQSFACDMQAGIIVTGLVGIAFVAIVLAENIERKEPPCDSFEQS